MRISRCRVKEKTHDRLAEFLSGGDGLERGGFGARQSQDGAPISFIGSVRSSLRTWRITCRSKGLSRWTKAILAAFGLDLPGDVPDRRRRYLEAAVNDVLAIAAAMCAPRRRGCGIARIAVVSLLRSPLLQRRLPSQTHQFCYRRSPC
jgi:hypothetical protein